MIPLYRPQPGPTELPSLAARVLRASPVYRLVPHRTLPEPQREAFAFLAEDPDHYGLLVPSERTELGVKAVDRDLAALFHRLRRPGSLGGSPADIPDDQTLLRLVVDGVLEVETEGGFASGPRACAALRLLQGAAVDGPISRASRCALEQAYHHPTDDPSELSAWIYRFGAMPATRVWQRQGSHTASLMESLGMQPGSARVDRLCDRYLETRCTGWSSWQLHNRGTAHLPYKLYVSPTPRAMGRLFGGILAALQAADVPAFKFGLGLTGLLRPDRLVAYLPSWDHLRRAALRLDAVVGEAPAHGVPFTASLVPTGTLSWGMDPPRYARLQGWGPGESWRSWVTNRAARALLVARGAGCDTKTALDFVAARLTVEGVDVSTWSPTPSLWTPEEGA